MDDVMGAALVDELAKIAAAQARMMVPQSRTGRRPISVDNYLRRDREGTLFKPQATSGTVPTRDDRDPTGSATQVDGRDLGALVPAGMTISTSDSGPMPRY
jgi:hypothetical protein